MLKVFYNKVNTSKSEIRFTFKEKRLFQKYLRVMCEILPSEHWRVNICSIRYKSQSDGKKTVSPFIDNKETMKRIEEFKSSQPTFKGSITTNNTYNGYALSVISPIQSKKNHSSPLMKYVLHFLLIVEGVSS